MQSGGYGRGSLRAFHADPKRAAQLGRMGGSKNRRHDPLRSETEPLRPPQTAKEVKDLLAEAMAGIHAGRLEPKIGSVMAYLGTALCGDGQCGRWREGDCRTERHPARRPRTECK